jgi:hypothetical protein
VDIKLGLDEEPTFHPLTFEVRIESRGLETDVRLGAYYNGETETNLGLLGMDYHWVSTGSGDANPLVDKVLNNDSVVLQLDKRPGLSWWETDLSTGLRVARQVHWIYRDNDRSGGYNAGDDLLAPATVCDDDGSPVYGRKLDAATDLATAFALERKGWHAGWRLYKGADDELASSAGSTLSIDPTGCVTPTAD